MDKLLWRNDLKKLIKKKNTYHKFVNNLDIISSHKITRCYHIMSKDYEKIYADLSPIYHSINEDFDSIDLIDLKFYERWLNG